jgi:hypothetical protein
MNPAGNQLSRRCLAAGDHGVLRDPCVFDETGLVLELMTHSPSCSATPAADLPCARPTCGGL